MTSNLDSCDKSVTNKKSAPPDGGRWLRVAHRDCLRNGECEFVNMRQLSRKVVEIKRKNLCVPDWLEIYNRVRDFDGCSLPVYI